VHHCVAWYLKQLLVPETAGCSNKAGGTSDMAVSVTTLVSSSDELEDNLLCILQNKQT